MRLIIKDKFRVAGFLEVYFLVIHSRAITSRSARMQTPQAPRSTPSQASIARQT